MAEATAGKTVVWMAASMVPVRALLTVVMKDFSMAAQIAG